ncbi:MAG: hypothetical protein WAX89_02350 [Alphaproteobacteria bacterium]
MGVRSISIILLFISAIALVTFSFVTPAEAQSTLSARDQQANAMAKDFYCTAYNVIGGKVGVLIGFGLAAGGFLMLLFQGFSMGAILFMAMGIFITAIPGWFESGVNGVGEIAAPLRNGGGAIVQGGCR